MAQRIDLVGYHMAAVQGKDQDPPAEDGTPGEVHDMWMLVFTENTTGSQIRIAFRRDARDTLVRQLTGGIVLAGGEFPRV